MAIKSFTPIFSRVLLEVIAAGDTYEGSALYRPKSEQDKDTRGIVVSQGPGKLLASGKYGDMPFQIGQKVIYQGYGAAEVKINGKDHVVVESEAILGSYTD